MATPTYFFIKSMACVGNEVTQVVLKFFQTGKLLKEVNCYNLYLIPKVDHPCDVSQFRPIACCNILYKIISKMMSNILKLVLSSIIYEVQSAFVGNRVIMHI